MFHVYHWEPCQLVSGVPFTCPIIVYVHVTPLSSQLTNIGGVNFQGCIWCTLCCLMKQFHWDAVLRDSLAGRGFTVFSFFLPCFSFLPSVLFAFSCTNVILFLFSFLFSLFCFFFGISLSSSIIWHFWIYLCTLYPVLNQPRSNDSL